MLQQARQVVLYARNEYRELVSGDVEVCSLESREISVLFQAEATPAQAQDNQWRSYDAVFSWHGSGNPDFVRKLQAATGGRAHCFSFRPAEPQRHQADYFLDCIGAQRPAQAVSVSLNDNAIRWRDSFWAAHALHRGPVLSLAPGSGAREKNWQPEWFATIAAWWRKTTGGEVLLLLGPVERERGGLDRLLDDALDPGSLSLGKVAAALARSAVYLGNDSGISHLAGAVGVRTVALFGPSDPRQWAPRGDKVLVLRRGLDCSPCSETIMKTCGHLACLRGFPPREVIAALARLPEVVTLTR